MISHATARDLAGRGVPRARRRCGARSGFVGDRVNSGGDSGRRRCGRRKTTPSAPGQRVGLVQLRDRAPTSAGASRRPQRRRRDHAGRRRRRCDSGQADPEPGRAGFAPVRSVSPTSWSGNASAQKLTTIVNQAIPAGAQLRPETQPTPRSRRRPARRTAAAQGPVAGSGEPRRRDRGSAGAAGGRLHLLCRRLGVTSGGDSAVEVTAGSCTRELRCAGPADRPVRRLVRCPWRGWRPRRTCRLRRRGIAGGGRALRRLVGQDRLHGRRRGHLRRADRRGTRTRSPRRSVGRRRIRHRCRASAVVAHHLDRPARPASRLRRGTVPGCYG